MNASSINIKLLNILLCVLFITACTSINGVSSRNDSTKPIYYIYLAGPEVFLPDPIAAGEKKKQRIQDLNEKHGWPFELIGLYPMDNDIPDFKPNRQTGLRIYQANIELMNKADFVVANMVRFRGPSMDVGTAFEMGYMRGLKKGVFAYYETYPFYQREELPGEYVERVQQFYTIDPQNPEKDIYGQSIESFEMSDNLMMIGALDDSDTVVKNSFDEAILAVAKSILRQRSL